MGHPIEQFEGRSAADLDGTFAAHDAALDAAATRAELRNANALADKLQTLLDSKTHQVEALHAELESARYACELAVGAQKRWQARCEEADGTIDNIMDVLRPHAAPVFAEAGTPLDVASHVASRLTTDPEPDIDTVPLADLLEAIGTYLEHDQAVTVRGSYEPVRQVDIHAMGLTFAVDTHEASEALTKLQELGGCVVVEAAR